MFSVNVDLSGLDALKDIPEELDKAAREAIRDLSAMTHAKVVELASTRLNTRRQAFIDGLSLREEQGVWLLELGGKARWIDDGMEKHSMLDALLASPKAKRAADGSVYTVVPFDHSPGSGPTNTTPTQLDLVNTVRTEMRKRKIPWAKVERDDQGRPKLGKLHKFNIESSPFKTENAPGQGWGPVGDVRQGYSERNARMREHGGPGGGGIPFLRGVAVYQHALEGGGVQRSVMTFRIASSKMEGQGRWEHPGLEPVNVFDDAYKWAMEELENKILPELVKNLTSKG
jgi:hypothetical protein